MHDRIVAGGIVGVDYASAWLYTDLTVSQVLRYIQRREGMMDAAEQIFVEIGFSGASIKNSVRRTGI